MIEIRLMDAKFRDSNVRKQELLILRKVKLSINNVACNFFHRLHPWIVEHVSKNETTEAGKWMSDTIAKVVNA
jgi:hypothetical protein